MSPGLTATTASTAVHHKATLGAVNRLNAKEQFSSRRSLLVTANVEVIEELAEDLERYVIYA